MIKLYNKQSPRSRTIVSCGEVIITTPPLLSGGVLYIKLYIYFENNKYIYQYKDHLGNVRISFGRDMNTGGLEITDANDYYPFGMSHLKTGNAYFGAGKYQNYKYNGKELQETGMYDYGARMYMPDIGRWGVVDPLAEKYQDLSPFRYSFNNPVNFVDPVDLTEEDPPNKKGIKETSIEEVVITVKRTQN
ncbi:hypothetical protein IW15_15955 [Chryseobacterium soli]|uniref:RHS repeat-associated core domain-containing protein n=1 Tax=Chryseobacterium soli TaxID=445961 RepID=A0A086A4T4_9FLAO|nr:RHS repeat-associated core domain-containing protein [Chryseobacterium soli]KFF11698.1 hypothetical protein IW15_15955 [Chryseobacterium soli]